MPITDSEKTRRRALLKAHYDAENNHDMDGIMATFSPDCEMLYNRMAFADPQGIRYAHGAMGFSGTDGAFEDIQHNIDDEHITEDEIVVEGRLSGKHVGDFQGFEATGRNVELPFVAFYRFDETDKLISERVVMNLGVLVANDTRVTAGEAQETIERPKSARGAAIGTLTPPKWLNALSSLLFGIFTMAASLQSGNVRWTVVLFLSALAFISTYVFLLRHSRILGATARFFPSTFSSGLVYVGQGVFFAVVIIGSQALHANGAAWAPYAAAIVNGAVFSYLMHNYPTDEWGTRAGAK